MGLGEPDRGKGDDHLIETVEKSPPLHMHIDEKAVYECQ
jgi:hypothetical protein